MRAGFYLLTALGAAGAWTSELLIEKHIGYLYGGAADTGLCAGAHVSCEEAAKSVMAEIGGLPIAALGLGFYLTVILLAGAWRFAGERFPRVPDVLLLTSGLAVVYSAVLGAYTLLALDRYCPLCLSLYGINAALFGTAFITHPGRKEGGMRPLAGLPKASATWLAVGLMVVMTVAAQGRYAYGAKAAHEGNAMRGPAPTLAAKAVEVVLGDSPGFGPEDAEVVVVEFSDFQCPHCERLASNLKAAARKAPEAFRYHFKHYPMDHACNPAITKPFHANGCRTAYAAECARQQGRFWEMHDAMFEHRAALEAEDLQKYARGVGLDVDRWAACIEDDQTKARVLADIEQGRALGVRGTPTFFVNGFRQEGGLPPESLLSLVEQAQAAAKQPSN